MRAGAAYSDITPPIGTSLAGYFRDRFSTAVHDPLLARALVLDDGRQTAAIVCCDLICITREQTLRTREIASKATGIAPEAIMICCTHTHTGPSTITSEAVQINEAYIEEMPGRIAEAIQSAHTNLRPATLRLGEERDSSVAFVRRFRMKGGYEAFNPGVLNPDIIGPAGEVDPQVNLLRVDDESGEPMALLGNYALHADVKTGDEISADWPGELCRILQGSYGSKPISLFANGACGNINHIDVTDSGPQSGWAKVQQIARVLGGKMLAASEKSRPMESQSVQVSSRILNIPYHPLTPELIAMAREVRSKPNPGLFEKLQADIVENYDLEGKAAEVEVQVIRVGDTALVGIPAEYFTEWGKEIKHWSPFTQTFVIELANDCLGYIPTLQAYYRGGYEAMPVLSVQLVPEAGLRMADAAIEMLRELSDVG